MTLAMPDPSLHRMLDPIVRRRVAAILAALFALAWSIVWVLGEPTGPFSRAELREVSGLPYAPPQIQRRIPPSAGDTAELQRQIDQLQDLLRGTPVQPSPAATR